jgi:hypothetical protein
MDERKYISRKHRFGNMQKHALLFLYTLSISLSGCFTGKPPANRAPAFVFARPVIPATTSAAVVEAPPDIIFEITPAPRLLAPRSSPPKPRVAQTAPTEPAVAQKPVDPIILPELSVDQLNSAKSETQHSLEIAEWNLSQSQGKKLNLAQEDVASKIRGFMETARDAMKNSDWQRAKNLAKKAEVLSHELVANL